MFINKAQLERKLLLNLPNNEVVLERVPSRLLFFLSALLRQNYFSTHTRHENVKMKKISRLPENKIENTHI